MRLQSKPRADRGRRKGIKKKQPAEKMRERSYTNAAAKEGETGRRWRQRREAMRVKWI